MQLQVEQTKNVIMRGSDSSQLGSLTFLRLSLSFEWLLFSLSLSLMTSRSLDADLLVTSRLSPGPTGFLCLKLLSASLKIERFSAINHNNTNNI